MKSTNTDRVTQKVAQILVDSGCVIFRTKIPFRYTSGILSPIYTDNRRLISLPKDRDIIIKFLIEKIKRSGIPDLVAGTATAGIPHAAWIAKELNLPMVYVRTQPKKHGQKNQVEGIAKRGQKAIVIEDLISTGNSSIASVKALRKMGIIVNIVFAIFTYNLESAKRNFAKNNVKLITLTDLAQTVQAARISQILRTDDQISQVLEWPKDPENWGKKMEFE